MIDPEPLWEVVAFFAMWLLVAVVSAIAVRFALWEWGAWGGMVDRVCIAVAFFLTVWEARR